MKPYKYRNIPIARPEFNIHGVSRVGVKEQLTGQIQGQKASDLEERQANSYDALKVGYTFRARITASAWDRSSSEPASTRATISPTLRRVREFWRS